MDESADYSIKNLKIKNAAYVFDVVTPTEVIRGVEFNKPGEHNLLNGLVAFAMAAETGEYGITATYIQPGGVMTPESRDTFRRHDGLRDHCIKLSASRRIGEPVDVAKVALFLASDDSAFVSGTGIAVDGGRLDE